MNKNVESFLNYYLSSQNTHPYAVLINGEWGSGKTWFIKKFLQGKKDDDLKNVSVSLYGLTSTDQIDDAIFKQLHPVLSSKSVVLASTIAKGLLKGTLKIDLEEHASANLNLNVPSIKISELTKSPSQTLLVFDDFERCEINPVTLLGYINQFIEGDECKVIIMSNEKEMFSKDEGDKNRYLRTKEKVIGKTFKLMPDTAGALTSFYDEIKNADLKKLLVEKKDWFLGVYEMSGCQNLRLLKNFLFEFERFYVNLDSEMKLKKLLCWELLYRNFIFYYEQKTVPWGREVFTENHWNYGSEDKRGVAEILQNKYEDIHFYDNVLSLKDWEGIIFDSMLDADSIKSSIRSSSHFSTSNEDWVELWYYVRQDDVTFENLVSSVYDKLKFNHINQVEKVLHAAGVLFNLNSKGLINLGAEKILSAAKENARHLIYLKEILVDSNELSASVNQESWGGLGFQGKNLPEFQELAQFICDESKSVSRNQYFKITEQMFSGSGTAHGNLEEMLSGALPEYRWMVTEPLLAYCEPKIFVDFYYQEKNKTSVHNAFKYRYIQNSNRQRLSDELPWLIQLKQEAETKCETLKGKLSGYLINGFIERLIIPAIKSFN